MGDCLTSDEQPTQNIIDYAELFDKQFPYYLAIGMSSAEYWDGDPSLTRYYRKAYKLKQEEKNYNMWLQGMYIYNAFNVVMYNAFKNKNKKSQDYPSKPYEFKSEKPKETDIKLERAKAAAWMNNLVSRYKKKG